MTLEGLEEFMGDNALNAEAWFECLVKPMMEAEGFRVL